MRLPGLAFRLTGISAIDQSLFPGRARFLDTNARHALPSKVVLSATSHVGLYGLSSVSTPSQSICTCSAYVNDLCVMSFPAGRMALAGSTSSENMYLASRNERTVYWPVLCAALRRLGTLGACMAFGSSLSGLSTLSGLSGLSGLSALQVLGLRVPLVLLVHSDLWSVVRFAPWALAQLL